MGDEMTLSVQHAFTTSSKLGVSGSSTYTEAVGDKKSVRTCLRKKSNDKACQTTGKLSDWDTCCHVFEAGATIRLTIAEWLASAGVSLDARVSSNVETDARTGSFPYRRVTGAKVHLQLLYYGDKNDDQFQCEIEAVAWDGWTSSGSDSNFVNYAGVGSQESEYFDMYKRGVRFEFFPKGVVTVFDPVVMVQTFVSGLVFLGIAEFIVKLVACYVVP